MTVLRGSVRGARNPLNGSTTHAYYCDESSGATTLVNSVAGAANPLSITGSIELDYSNIFRNRTRCAMCHQGGTADRAFASGASISPTSGMTIEAIVGVDAVAVATTFGSTTQIILEVADTARTSGINLALLNGVLVTTVFTTGGSFTASGINIAGSPVHAAAVYNSVSGRGEIWVNGNVFAASGVISGSFNTFTRIALGNTTQAVPAFPSHGFIADFRITPSGSLAASYFKAATKAMAFL
jgi:hypothetical protein